MKKVIIILGALIFISFLILSCQRSEETKGKREIQVQKEEVKQQPLETKPEARPKQEDKLPTTQEAKEEKKEETIETKSSALTEKEQKEFGGGLEGEITFKEALTSLRILIKGDYKTIRWYQEWGKEYNRTEKDVIDRYETDLCAAVKKIAAVKSLPAVKVRALNKPTPSLKLKDELDLTIKVIETKSSSPKAVACASEAIGWFQDNKAVPVLKELIKNKDPEIKLQSAGSLLILGEGNIALPVLDELAKLGIHQSTFALNKLFAWEVRKEFGEKPVVSHTKLWDERGKEILISALDYSSDEVKAYAAMRLAEMGIENELVEEVALSIVEKLMYRKEKDYGIGRQKIPNETYSKTYVLPGYEGKKIEELEKPYYSDARACETAIHTLGKLKSKRAIPLLKHIHEKNTGLEYVCHENLGSGGGIARGGGGIAENTLKKILENGGGK